MGGVIEVIFVSSWLRCEYVGTENVSVGRGMGGVVPGEWEGMGSSPPFRCGGGWSNLDTWLQNVHSCFR